MFFPFVCMVAKEVSGRNAFFFPFLVFIRFPVRKPLRGNDIWHFSK
jgi:hypothetical protein